MIKIENLSKSFGNNRILKGINLTVDKGEVVSIIGTSGTGKSTFLRCLDYLEKPDSGTITIGDVTLDAEKATKQDIERLRLKSAMIFQNYNLFLNKTVMQNVTLPLISTKRYSKKEAEEIALKFLKKVGMAHKVDSYPITLSGGEQQRVSIARSIASSPEVLLFDEPTSSLDPSWKQEVLEVIRSLANEHYTMIIVTHEMEFAKEVSDKIVFMSEGIIEEEGTPNQIFKNAKSEKTKKFLARISQTSSFNEFFIRKSLNYKKLLPLFKEAGLDVELDEPDPKGLLMCFELFDKKSNEVVGASSIIRNKDIYQIKTFAISKPYQGRGVGRYLMDSMVDELREWGAKKVYLNAKEPDFYEKVGFVESDIDVKDIMYDCGECDHLNKSCFPKTMELSL
ncbi:GNAT family N-acetyltransferase [Peptoniphilus sp.]|uniref:GNAT family N-acetyltransferase n=1 Tax=Peptoniphilus sp. TaxID=1971214 RepID=UPI00399588C5